MILTDKSLAHMHSTFGPLAQLSPSISHSQGFGGQAALPEPLPLPDCAFVVSNNKGSRTTRERTPGLAMFVLQSIIFQVLEGNKFSNNSPRGCDFLIKNSGDRGVSQNKHKNLRTGTARLAHALAATVCTPHCTNNYSTVVPRAKKSSPCYPSVSMCPFERVSVCPCVRVSVCPCVCVCVFVHNFYQHSVTIMNVFPISIGQLDPNLCYVNSTQVLHSSGKNVERRRM